MRIAISDEETIPEWLYPGSFSDMETPDIDVIDVTLRVEDFQRLWETLIPETADPVTSHSYFDDCGIPHDAPSGVLTLRIEFLRAITSIPAHERWRFAALLTLEPRPHRQRLQHLKSIFNQLCELATRALDSERMLILLDED